MLELLRSSGYFESALLHAYFAGRQPHPGTSTKLLKRFFRLGDRARLRDLGDPLPLSGTFQLYRGVAGANQHRRIRGLAWTDSLERAC